MTQRLDPRSWTGGHDMYEKMEITLLVKFDPSPRTQVMTRRLDYGSWPGGHDLLEKLKFRFSWNWNRRLNPGSWLARKKLKFRYFMKFEPTPRPRVMTRCLTLAQGPAAMIYPEKLNLYFFRGIWPFGHDFHEKKIENPFFCGIDPAPGSGSWPDSHDLQEKTNIPFFREIWPRWHDLHEKNWNSIFFVKFDRTPKPRVMTRHINPASWPDGHDLHE
jgi:hypothetical protein